MAYEALISSGLSDICSGATPVAVLSTLSPGVADVFENLMPVTGPPQEEWTPWVFCTHLLGALHGLNVQQIVSIKDPRSGARTVPGL